MYQFAPYIYISTLYSTNLTFPFSYLHEKNNVKYKNYDFKKQPHNIASYIAK